MEDPKIQKTSGTEGKFFLRYINNYTMSLHAIAPIGLVLGEGGDVGLQGLKR